jgi:hypothetical protein
LGVRQRKMCVKCFAFYSLTSSDLHFFGRSDFETTTILLSWIYLSKVDLLSDSSSLERKVLCVSLNSSHSGLPVFYFWKSFYFSSCDHKFTYGMVLVRHSSKICCSLKKICEARNMPDQKTSWREKQKDKGSYFLFQAKLLDW